MSALENRLWNGFALAATVRNIASSAVLSAIDESISTLGLSVA